MTFPLRCWRQENSYLAIILFAFISLERAPGEINWNEKRFFVSTYPIFMPSLIRCLYCFIESCIKQTTVSSSTIAKYSSNVLLFVSWRTLWIVTLLLSQLCEVYRLLFQFRRPERSTFIWTNPVFLPLCNSMPNVCNFFIAVRFGFPSFITPVERVSC